MPNYVVSYITVGSSQGHRLYTVSLNIKMTLTSNFPCALPCCMPVPFSSALKSEYNNWNIWNVPKDVECSMAPMLCLAVHDAIISLLHTAATYQLIFAFPWPGITYQYLRQHCCKMSTLHFPNNCKISIHQFPL